MKRQYLIVIAVLVVALLACGCAGMVALITFWPTPDPRAPEDWSPPEVPDVRSGRLVAPDGPHEQRNDAELPADPKDLLPGVWVCAQGNSRIQYGSGFQFIATQGSAGTVYVTDDASSADWIEAEYELGSAGYLVITPVSYDLWPVSSSYAVEFADPNTMWVRSMESGDEGDSPAGFVRVE